jgi:hypothetical protein
LLSAVVGCSSSNADDDDDSGGESGETGSGGSGNGGSGGKGGSSAGGSSAGGSDGGTTSGGSSGKGGSSGTGGSSGSSGSSGSGGAPDIGDIVPDEEAEWTVFVYGHGDHNLSNSLFADLGEMAQADLGASGDVNVLVLTDWNASQAFAGSDPPEYFPTGIQLFKVPGGGEALEVVAEGSEQSLDDPAVLTSIIGDVFRAFPARRHGVILWDHGGAWSGGFGSDSNDGTVAMPTAMPAEAIPPAIAAGLSAAGVDATPPLDFVAFDTCLMGGAEVAYPFRDLASVYIANAEIDYGAGWDYTATFSYLADNLDATPAELARAEVSHWNAHHAEVSPNDALLRSHAAIDLTKLDAFAEATQSLTSALSDSATFEVVELGRYSFFALPPYASQFENAASSAPGLRDAGQLLDALAASPSDEDVASAAAAARSALDDMILATSQGALRVDSAQAGFHVELGAAATLTSSKLAEYESRASEWDGASGWHSLLGALASGADGDPPTYTRSVDNSDGATASAPPVFRFASPDADVAQAEIYLGAEITSGSVVVLGLVASSTIEADSDYEFGWDGMVATFADEQPAMLDVWLDTGSTSGELVLMIPGLLSGVAEEPLMTTLVFSSSEGGASVAVVSLGSVASTLSLGEIAQAAPGATFTPVYYSIDTATGASDLIAGDPMPLPESGTYTLSSTYVNPGSYYFFSSLTDVWGNSGVEVDPFTLAEPLGP